MAQMYINGVRRDASDGGVLEVLNPATHRVIGVVPSATAADASEALAVAASGRKEWAATPLWKRIEMIDKFIDILKAHWTELQELITAETGKPLSEADGEVDTAYWVFRGFKERVSQAMYGMATPLDIQPGLPGDYMITRREPLGVMVAILPFNFPVELYAHKVAPALLTGNVVVVKPSEDTPLTAIKMTEYLLEAGVPGYALQCLTGYGETVGEALCTSPLVQAISMTGSTEVGTHVYQNAARHLSRVFLELGGNDPLIVLPDADLDWAVQLTARGRTVCSGQCCCANKRMIVHRDVAAEYTERLLAKLSKEFPVGDPRRPETKVGPLISEAAAARAEEQVQRTVAQGARLALGGRREDRTYLAPTVLLDVRPEMDVARDMEIFAPVFPIIEVGSTEEALHVANQTNYGLNAGVFTRDIQTAFTLAAQIESGLVVINGTPLYRPYNHPHGGIKRTGLGREGLDSTLEELTEVKSIVFRKAIGL